MPPASGGGGRIWRFGGFEAEGDGLVGSQPLRTESRDPPWCLPNLLSLSRRRCRRCGKAVLDARRMVIARTLAMASIVASAYKPVVIFCHGSGDTPRGVEQWVRSLATATELAEFEWVGFQ